LLLRVVEITNDEWQITQWPLLAGGEKTICQTADNAWGMGSHLLEV